MNKNTIAREVADLLQLPRCPARFTKSYSIVKAILQVITDALWRGERVEIEGFGIFEITERKPLGRSSCFTTDFKQQRNLERYYYVTPAKRFVKFKPSKVLQRMVQ